jgi:uncharacterized protein YcbX
MPSTAQVEIGSVVSLWRHPVKSMMGEELNATAVTERGLLGDRAYALVDSSDGKVATAKNPRKWPNLFDFRATFIEPPRLSANVPPVRITLPDDAQATSQQSDLSPHAQATTVRIGHGLCEFDARGPPFTAWRSEGEATKNHQPGSESYLRRGDRPQAA